MSDDGAEAASQVGHIQINLEGIAGTVATAVALANRRVAIGLQTDVREFDDHVVLPGAELELSLQVPGAVDTSESWTNWMLGNGFRDLAASVSRTLEDVFCALHTWDYFKDLAPGVMFRTTTSEFEANFLSRLSAFHEAHFPDKIRKLAALDFELPARTLEQYKSIIAARNCLVHRNGVVGKIDLKGQPSLVLDWRAALVLLERDGKFEDLPFNVPIVGGGNVVIRIADQRQEYHLGESLNISSKQFAQIGWSLWVFAQELAVLLTTIARERGIRLDEPATMTSSEISMRINRPLRDLEHRFEIDGRSYVIQVCGCGNHPAPVSAGPADGVLFECVPDELLDHEDDSPDKVVRDVIDHAKKFMPGAISPEQWAEFANAVHEWVCEHRAAASRLDHEA